MTSPRSSIQIRLTSVVVVHLLVLLCFNWLDVSPTSEPFVVPCFLALVFTDAGLLGIFLSLAEGSRWMRCGLSLLGFAAVFGAQTLVTGTNRNDTTLFLVLMSITFLAVATIGGIIRWKGSAIRRPEPGETYAAEALRFSVKHLFIMTTVIGVSLALLRSVRDLPQNNWMTVGVIYGQIFFVSPVLFLWAALGSGRIVVRSLIGMILAVIPGFLPSVYFPEREDFFWVMPQVTFAQGIISLATLLVVRSVGYRLLRTKKDEAPETAEVSAGQVA